MGAQPLPRVRELRAVVMAYADTYVPGPPYCTYGLRVPASCVMCVPVAQGSTPYTY